MRLRELRHELNRFLICGDGLFRSAQSAPTSPQRFVRARSVRADQQSLFKGFDGFFRVSCSVLADAQIVIRSVTPRVRSEGLLVSRQGPGKVPSFPSVCPNVVVCIAVFRHQHNSLPVG
jgi:hypothetical protein